MFQDRATTLQEAHIQRLEAVAVRVAAEAEAQSEVAHAAVALVAAEEDNN